MSYLGKELWYEEGAILSLWENVKVTGFNGFSEYYTSRNAIDECELAFFRSLELSDGHIVDVGANLGVVTALFGHQWPDRQIHAFEPGPSTFNSLEATIRLNNLTNVIPKNSAVGEEPGDVLFDTHPHSRATAKLSGVEPSSSVESDTSKTTVPIVSLDAYARDQKINKLSLLKIDVEGYEPLVLEGAEELLSNQRIKIVYFEVCPPLLREAGFSPSTPCEILSEYEYRLFRLGPEGLVPVTPEDVESVSLENWVAMSPSECE